MTRIDAQDFTLSFPYNGGYHFIDYVQQNNEYVYDKNGNMTQDLNKRISSIQYNLLNLPTNMIYENGNYYGARHYDPCIMRFTTMDPMCEKYYNLSPYAYCGNNPVNAVDEEGKKTIFVNGLQKFGSLSGTDYWGGEKGAFVYGAKIFFKDVSTPYFVNYDYALNSENVMSIDALYNQGYNYAKEKYSEITADISKESDVLHFVSHSMGSAFSEGMMTYLSQRGWTIDVAIHMNAWRPHELYGTPGIVRVDATTTLDPVQNLFIGKPIFVSNDIPIANYKLRKKGVLNLFYNHKGLINDDGEIWHPQSNSWNEIMSKIREYVIQNPEIKITVK